MPWKCAGTVLLSQTRNDQRGALDGTWWEQGGDTGAVRQARIQQRLLLADLVAEDAGDIADGDLQAALGERFLWTRRWRKR